MHSALILASASPRRQALLGRLGRPLRVEVAATDESPLPGEPPVAYARRLALAKAAAVAARVHDPSVRAGSDYRAPADPEPPTGWPAANSPTHTTSVEVAAPDTTPNRPPLVIGADTIVVESGAVLGKPTSPGDARRMLRRLRSRRHLVVTAVAVIAHNHPPMVGHDVSAVWLRPLDDAEIAAYVTSGRALDKAGAYAIQDAEWAPVARLEGSETNVVGLPVRLTRRLVAQADSARPHR